jgi:hypothetical protein
MISYQIFIEFKHYILLFTEKVHDDVNCAYNNSNTAGCVKIYSIL